METTITIFHEKASDKDNVYRGIHIMASYKSTPKHHMDSCGVLCQESDKINIENEIKKFTRRLKDLVYEREDVEFKIIDDRDFSLPYLKFN